MLTICLTTIPPRFPGLARTTECLLAQSITARVVVCIPKAYRRFPGPVEVPSLPIGVIVARPPNDHGPATKLLGCLNDPDASDILYCDDDWEYGPDWAARLVAARQSPCVAVAASAFSVDRLKRRATPPFDRIAQGFGGVLVRKGMFDADVFDMPAAAFAADDIWLSGHLAAKGVEIVVADDARLACAPIPVPGPQLQTARVNGMTRADANTACADAITRKFGLWPGVTERPSAP